MTDEDTKKAVDGDYQKGMVWYKDPRSGKNIRVCEKKRQSTTNDLTMCEDLAASTGIATGWEEVVRYANEGAKEGA